MIRVLIIAALCLALASPRVFSERLSRSLSKDRPVTVALIFDTSPSMEYSVKGRTRLEDARQRAREFLDELPDGSKVAVLDSAELGGEWQSAVARAREQVDKLQIRAANSPLTRQIAQAYRLFDNLSQEEDAGAEPPPTIGVELNRLEDQGGNCRAYLVITNPGSAEFSGFALDLVVFDRGGTIVRRLAVDAAPLRPAKTSVSR